MALTERPEPNSVPQPAALDYDEPYRFQDDERRRLLTSAAEERQLQQQSWAILAGMIIISLAYHLIIFALQPGLR